MSLDKLNSKEIFDLWSSGENINSAIEKYCDTKLIKQEVKNKSNHAENSAKGLLAEKNKRIENLSEFEKYEQALYDDLSDKLRFGSLVSIGYEEPIGGSDFPELLSRQVWPPDEVGLEYSSIRKGKKRFSSIRITENPFYKKDKQTDNNELPSIELKKVDPGRPSMNDEWVNAIKQLIKAGTITADNTQADNIRLAQDTLTKMFKDEDKVELIDDPRDKSSRKKRKILKGAGYDTIDKLIKDNL